MTATRRLTAILAADVAGYSRLMGADEEGTLERLKALRRELVDPKIAEHRGRIVKTTGDGLLVEFASVVDAVRCAVAVQQAIPELNTGVEVDNRIELRIGINLGDVIVEGDDLYGDGVNIAARIEALADAGGVFVSNTVHDHVRDRLPFAFEDLGEQQVKNITRPVRVYRVRDAIAAVKAAIPPALPLPDKPSIAVLPFANMSGDPEQEYFADGMVDEIITALSRIRWLFVIARNSSFTYKGRAVDVKQVARELGVRYVLEGSVRKAGNRVRITGQLIDTATGAHIWADRFDGALDDIFELQDRVASGVVGAIEPKLRSAEIERAIRKPTDSLDAYDLHLRALAEFRKWTPESWREAIDLLRRALIIDPSYAPAAGLFAWCRVLQLTNRAVPSNSEEDLAEGVRFARRAIEAGKEDPDALWMGGWTILTLGGDRATGLSAIEHALRLNPNSALGWSFFGWAQGMHNRLAPAVEALERAMRLSPLDPLRQVFYGGLAYSYFAAGRYEEAIEWADRALNAQPRMPAVVAIKAASCAHLGRVGDAGACVRRFCELRPGATIGSSKGTLGTSLSPEVLAAWVDGLRKAGLPEE
jgi:TolB-like protein/class 3 adenylate cyclase